MLPANPGSTPQRTHSVTRNYRVLYGFGREVGDGQSSVLETCLDGLRSMGDVYLTADDRTDRLGASHGGSYAADEFVG
jgi:hypothetical protein